MRDGYSLFVGNVVWFLCGSVLCFYNALSYQGCYVLEAAARVGTLCGEADMIKYYQSTFNPVGHYVSGQIDETIADWLNRLSKSKDVRALDRPQVILIHNGILVLVAALTQEERIEV